MIESSQTLDFKSLTSEIDKLCKMFPTSTSSKAKTKTKTKTNKIPKRKLMEPVRQPEKKPPNFQRQIQAKEASACESGEHADDQQKAWAS